MLRSEQGCARADLAAGRLDLLHRLIRRRRDRHVLRALSSLHTKVPGIEDDSRSGGGEVLEQIQLAQVDLGWGAVIVRVGAGDRAHVRDGLPDRLRVGVDDALADAAVLGEVGVVARRRTSLPVAVGAVANAAHAERPAPHLEQVLLIRRARASVGGLRRAIVLPEVDARHVPGWALRVRRVGRAAALLPRPVVVGMMVVDEARVEPAPAWSMLRRRHTSVPCQHP